MSVFRIGWTPGLELADEDLPHVDFASIRIAARAIPAKEPFAALPTTPAFPVIDSARDRRGVVVQPLELPPVEEDVRLVHGCLANVAGLLPVLAVGMRHFRYLVHPFHPKA